MSESANDEVMIETEINMGGNRETIAELGKMAVRLYNDQNVKCSDCGECDGWCATYGCRIIRKAMRVLYDNDVTINRINVELARKQQRIERLEQNGNDAIINAIRNGCTDDCVYYTEDIEKHCKDTEYTCNNCEIMKECPCFDCLSASHFKWNEIEERDSI